MRVSPLGVVTAVENTKVPLRHAPGLSLNAMSGPPAQIALFVAPVLVDELELLVDLMPDDTHVLVLDPERARSRAWCLMR